MKTSKLHCSSRINSLLWHWAKQKIPSPGEKFLSLSDRLHPRHAACGGSSSPRRSGREPWMNLSRQLVVVHRNYIARSDVALGAGFPVGRQLRLSLNTCFDATSSKSPDPYNHLIASLTTAAMNSRYMAVNHLSPYVAISQDTKGAEN